MAFYMIPGQGPKAKTGGGVPSSLMGGPKIKSCGGPMMHGGSHDDPDPKKKPKSSTKTTVTKSKGDQGYGSVKTTVNTTKSSYTPGKPGTPGTPGGGKPTSPKGKGKIIKDPNWRPTPGMTKRANEAAKKGRKPKVKITSDSYSYTTAGIRIKGLSKAKPSGEIIVPEKPKRTLTPPSGNPTTSKKTTTAKLTNYFKNVNLGIGRGSTKSSFKAGCLTD